MADPWLTLIGPTEAGRAALAPESRAAIDAAEVIFGGPRHLALAGAAERGRRPRPAARARRSLSRTGGRCDG